MIPFGTMTDGKPTNYLYFLGGYRGAGSVLLFILLLKISSCESLMMPIPPYRGIAQLLAIGRWGLWIDSIGYKISQAKKTGLLRHLLPDLLSSSSSCNASSNVLYLDLTATGTDHDDNSLESSPSSSILLSPPSTTILSIDNLPPLPFESTDSTTTTTTTTTRIVVLSDTHGKHRFLNVPNGDILCHCGDILLRYGFWGDYGRGQDGFQDFLEWMIHEQPHPTKIFIGGNHDTYMEDFQPSVQEEVQRILTKNPTSKTESTTDTSTTKVVYLENNHTIVSGWKIWGSPYSLPTGTSNRAFQYDDETANDIFDGMDNDVDIVLTHSGVFASNIMEKITTESRTPLLWLCGHFHDGYGKPQVLGSQQRTTFKINCATTDMKYRTRNLPVVIDIPTSRQQTR